MRVASSPLILRISWGRREPATLKRLRDRGVKVHVEETMAAMRLYNDLAGQGVPVGGLFHSTC